MESDCDCSYVVGDEFGNRLVLSDWADVATLARTSSGEAEGKEVSLGALGLLELLFMGVEWPESLASLLHDSLGVLSFSNTWENRQNKIGF